MNEAGKDLENEPLQGQSLDGKNQAHQGSASLLESSETGAGSSGKNSLRVMAAGDTQELTPELKKSLVGPKAGIGEDFQENWIEL
jgi:hypothetical protein